MGMYFFHLRDREGYFPDDEGSDFPDLEAAQAVAVATARALIAENAVKGLLDLSGVIETCASDGSVLSTIRFDEVVSPKPNDE